MNDLVILLQDRNCDKIWNTMAYNKYSTNSTSLPVWFGFHIISDLLFQQKDDIVIGWPSVYWPWHRCDRDENQDRGYVAKLSFQEGEEEIGCQGNSWQLFFWRQYW